MQSPSFRPGRASRLALVALLTLTTSCAAFGGDRETYRCNTSNGHYDETQVAIWDKTKTISGRINVHSVKESPDWGSSAKIAFTDTTTPENDCHCNGILLTGHEDGANVTFSILVNGEPVAMTNRILNTAITFKISIDAANQMTVQVGKEHMVTQTTGLPRPARNALLMTCSGMDVSFLNIDPQ